MINKTPKKTTPPPASKPEKPIKQAPLKPVSLPQTKPPATLINSYKKKQQTAPFIIWSLVLLLVFAGIALLIVWLVNGNGPKMAIPSLFATETPTPTVTSSPTSTSTFTPTATETLTPTVTLSPTPDKPYNYTVAEGDTLAGIVEKFKLGNDGLPLLLLLNPNVTAATLHIGDVLLIPNPDMKLPTETPLPANLPRGTKIEYTIQAGDTIAGIASKFNSTEEDILKENGIAVANAIQAGEIITVKANLVTPTASPQPTITPTVPGAPSATPPSPFTATPVGG